MKARILVIDDEAEVRRSVGMILRYDDYEVIEASSGPEGIAIAEKEAPDLVFLDIKMPGMDGLEVLQRLRAANENLPVVIISGHGTVSTAVEATKAGAFDFIEKPPSSEKLLVSIRNALERTRLSDENRSLRRAAEVRHQMVGESPRSARCGRDQARRPPMPPCCCSARVGWARSWWREPSTGTARERGSASSR
jgi:two-component system nitrogen regulation response regulator NtrX